MSIYPIALRLATNVHWHVRLVGNGQTALFKFMQDVSKAQTTYTVRLHQNYMVNITKLTEFEFKAMLGRLYITFVVKLLVDSVFSKSTEINISL